MHLVESMAYAGQMPWHGLGATPAKHQRRRQAAMDWKIEASEAGVVAFYAGGGRGAMLASSRSAAWGVLNSLTEFVDHHQRARSDDHRRDAAWFGQRAAVKQRTWDEVMELIA